MDREAMLQAFYFGLYGLPPATDLPSVPSRFRAPAGAAAGAPGAARAGEASGERLKRLAGNLQQLQITLQEALRQAAVPGNPGLNEGEEGVVRPGKEEGSEIQRVLIISI